MTRTTYKSLKVFCSYSHADKEYLKELSVSFAGMRQQGLIEREWTDHEIIPSQEWDTVISKNLNISDIIIFLVTPDFMNSEYINAREITRALERHERGEARVIPVIVRPTDWQWAPFSKLHALPTGAKPVVSWAGGRDEAWLDVVRGVRRAIQDLMGNRDARGQEAQEPDEGPEHAGLDKYREAVQTVWSNRELSEQDLA